MSETSPWGIQARESMRTLIEIHKSFDAQGQVDFLQTYFLMEIADQLSNLNVVTLANSNNHLENLQGLGWLQRIANNG